LLPNTDHHPTPPLSDLEATRWNVKKRIRNENDDDARFKFKLTPGAAVRLQEVRIIHIDGPFHRLISLPRSFSRQLSDFLFRPPTKNYDITKRREMELLFLLPLPESDVMVDKI
jgi:hypothetical protein